MSYMSDQGRPRATKGVYELRMILFASWSFAMKDDGGKYVRIAYILHTCKTQPTCLGLRLGWVL